MPIFTKENQTLLFIHIPKTGGSSFEKILSGLGWSEYLSIRGRKLNEIKFLQISPQHFHGEIINSFVNFDYIDKAILIIRNPFDRFKSEYYWQLKQGITSLNAEDWIKYVLDQYKNNPSIFDNHLRHQHEFMIPFDNLEVFKLENDGIKNAINSVVKLNESEYGLNRFFEKNVNARVAKIMLKVKDKKSNYRDDIEKSFLHNQDLIVSFYKKDYEFFNYEF